MGESMNEREGMQYFMMLRALGQKKEKESEG